MGKKDKRRTVVPVVVDEGPRCELCGEPAGAGNALCPACAASRVVPSVVMTATVDPSTARLSVTMLTAKERALIDAVRAHAEQKVEGDGDPRWFAVMKMTDAELWEVIQWCEFPKGAISLVGRLVNKLTVAGAA